MFARTAALFGMLVIVCSVLIEGSRVSPEMMGSSSERFTFIRPRVFEAIGVISFAFVSLSSSFLFSNLHRRRSERRGRSTDATPSHPPSPCPRSAITTLFSSMEVSELQLWVRHPLAVFFLSLFSLVVVQDPHSPLSRLPSSLPQTVSPT